MYRSELKIFFSISIEISITLIWLKFNHFLTEWSYSKYESFLFLPSTQIPDFSS